jgi:hypothetical protein
MLLLMLLLLMRLVLMLLLLLLLLLLLFYCFCCHCFRCCCFCCFCYRCMPRPTVCMTPWPLQSPILPNACEQSKVSVAVVTVVALVLVMT